MHSRTIQPRFSTAVALLALSMSATAGEKMNQIFDSDTLGANLPYLEQITGPAKKTFTWSKSSKTNTYKVEGCEISVDVLNGTVQSLGVEKLSPKCTVNLAKFIPNAARGLPLADKLTFGQFDNASGNSGLYGADCLMLCGNAADPVAYEVWQGSRADNSLEVTLSTILDGAAFDAGSVWKEAMLKKESDDWLIDRKFVCNRAYNEIARKAFKNQRITSIKIGFNLAAPACKP